MSMFSFDRPVKMKAADQSGFSSSATVNRGNTRIAGGVNWDKANWINKTYGGKASNWYENNPNKPDASNPHVPAGSYFPRASLDTPKDTEIAGTKGTIQIFKEKLIDKVNTQGYENSTEYEQRKYDQYKKDMEGGKNQNIFGELFKLGKNVTGAVVDSALGINAAQASEMPTNSSIKGGYRPSGIVTNLPSNYKESEAKAFADAKAYQDSKGIRTPASETKVTETKRMAGGFFSPQNFQKSGVPDATIMTGEQMRQALTGDPGYSRFGTLDRPGTQAAKDTAAFNQRVKSDFFSPVKADARSIAERREANVQSMRDEARERDTQFRTTGKQTFGGRVGERVSGDDTYGTNVMSNPAFGFRSKMSDENKARYDASAKEATRRSEVEPSKGNLIQSTVNVGKRIFNTAIGANEGTPFTKEVALQKRGEAEQRRYEKYLNRPTYQKEATARKEAGITNQMTIDKNKAQVAADAAARTKEFESNKRAAAVERAAKRTPENKGSGRSGTFGAGTTGRGMPSNPSGMRQRGVGVSANNLSRHSPGTSKDQPSSTATGDTSFASYVRGGGVGQKRGDSGGDSANKSKGSVSTTTRQGKPRTKAQMAAAERKASGTTRAQRNAARKKAMQKKAKERNKAFKAKRLSKQRQKARDNARKRSLARKRKNRRRRRCDIRCKYNIMPLTNMNLIKDDLAEVAYFVKELQKN